MGATHVTVTIRNPADPDRAWEGLFLVDTGAIDSLVPRPHLESIGLRPKGRRVYELADGREIGEDRVLDAVGARRSVTMLELESLNVNQRQAVGWNGGPMLVLAGPGAGKTRVLTTRVARLIQETPDKRFRVLALTFTTPSAMEEERRNCFVAITRVQASLTLTHADSYFGWSRQPSPFLAEMGLQPGSAAC